MVFTELLQNILKSYGLAGEIVDYKNFVEQNETQGVLRYVTYVQTPTHKVVVKINRDRDVTKQTIGNRASFSQYLRNNGILTPKLYRSNGAYRTDWRVDGAVASVTVESWLGESVQVLTTELAYAVGQLLGGEHALAQKGNCHIAQKENPFLHFVGQRQINGFDVLKRLDKEDKIKHQQFLRIKRMYTSLVNRFAEQRTFLPAYAVQGNHAIENLTVQGSMVGVFNYNSAGDDVLLSDMIAEGLYLAHEMTYPPETLPGEIYVAFEEGYFSKRQLGAKEQELYEVSLAFAQALWLGKIEGHSESLTALLQSSNQREATHLLNMIEEELTECMTL